MSYLHHQYWPISPVIPARTGAASPTTTPWFTTDGHLYGLRAQIPVGHAGLTGVRVTYQGQQIIPWGGKGWLVSSADVYDVPWDQEIMGGGLAVVTFNTDLVPHQVFLFADIVPVLPADEAAAPPPPTAPKPSAATLAAVGRLSA